MVDEAQQRELAWAVLGNEAECGKAPGSFTGGFVLAGKIALFAAATGVVQLPENL